MHSFDNGTSIETKLGNWSIIKRVFYFLYILPVKTFPDLMAESFNFACIYHKQLLLAA